MSQHEINELAAAFDVDPEVVGVYAGRPAAARDLPKLNKPDAGEGRVTCIVANCSTGKFHLAPACNPSATNCSSSGGRRIINKLVGKIARGTPEFAAYRNHPKACKHCFG